MTFDLSVLRARWLPRDRLISPAMIVLVSLGAIFVLSHPPSASTVRLLHDFQMPMAVLLVCFLALTFRKKGLLWELCSLVLVITLFILPLIYKWQTAFFNGSMIGGLLPWQDALAYYTGAQHLTEAGFLTQWTTRRPLFTGFLTVLLWITRNNLQLALTFLALFNGLAVFLAGREIQRVTNAFVASTFIVICYWYYIEHAGTVTTENLAFCMSVLAIAFLIRGSERTSLAAISYGLFLLATALSIRAGAFFILPALLLWFLIVYRKVFGWKGFAAVCLAVLIAMGSNVLFQRSIGHPNGVLFSNYSETLYGLASGNAGWTQVYKDYPDVVYSAIYGLAIDKIRSEPGLFIQGMAGAFRDYFRRDRGAFSFLRLVGDRNAGNISLWILTWAGIAAILYRSKNARSWMILFAWAGILFSTFLLPPIDANFMRVYAATVPFTAFLTALGLGVPEIFFQKLGLSLPASQPEWKTDLWLLPFSMGLLLVLLLSPLIVRVIQNPVKIGSSLGCAPDEVEILFRTGDHSAIQLWNDDDVSRSFVPNVKASVFRKSMFHWTWTYTFITEEFMKLEPGYSINLGGMYTLWPQRSDGMESGFLLTKGKPLPPGDHQICVTPAADENLMGTFFYDTDSSPQKLEPSPSLPFANWARRLYGPLIFAIILSLFDFWRLRPARKLLVLGNLFLILASLFIYLHSTNQYPLSWSREVLKTENAVAAGGYGYQLNLGADWIEGRSPDGSPVVVYEDGIPLKKPNQDLSEVKQLGNGRYSIADGILFFSASDSSSPQNNGRTYEIYGPTLLPPFLKYVSYLAALVAVIFLARYFVAQ